MTRIPRSKAPGDAMVDYKLAVPSYYSALSSPSPERQQKLVALRRRQAASWGRGRVNVHVVTLTLNYSQFGS